MSDFKAFNSRQKSSFLREIIENADLHKPACIKQINDHTRIMRKIQFLSSFLINRLCKCGHDLNL